MPRSATFPSRAIRSARCSAGVLAAVATALAAALLSCSSTPADDEPAPRNEPVRLLERLAGATITARDLDVMAGAPGPIAAADLAMSEEFAGGASWPGPWLDPRVLQAAIADPAAAGALPRLASAPESVDGDSVLRLAGAGAGIVALIPAAADETWLVRARVRALAATAPVRGELAWVPLRFDPPPFAQLLARAAELSKEFGARPRVRPLATDAGTQWQELTLLARPDPLRKALAVSLTAGPDGLLVDRVEVRRLAPVEALALASDDSVEPPTDPLRRRVALDLETWDCLALPTPASAAFELWIPRERPRLELACAALTETRPSAEPATLRFRVTVDDGELVFESTRSAERGRPLAFAPATIDLARFAGKRVRLTLLAEGPRGAVALFGAPTVLGAPEPARADAPASVRPPPRGVVLISLDTLRADHVGCYGAPMTTGARTPRIDALAGAGIRFEHVLSPASYTLPTHLTMMSGQDPLVHATVKSTQPMDPARTSMLAQRFRDAGWRTAAFTAGALVHPRYGFGVGFDSYSVRDPGGIVGLHRRIGDEADSDALPGEDRMGRVVDWLTRNADQPFFLFVHTYLVHNYRPSQADLDAIGGGPRPTPEELDALRKAASGGDPAAIGRMHALYRASIAQADREIVGRLEDALAALRLTDRTLVVLVADHGEEFFEHAMIGHGNELWHSLTRVPWIVRGGGVPRGRVRDDPVALADVAPTIAAWAGLPPDGRVLARNQLAADPDENRAEPKLLSLRDAGDFPDQDALVLWPWKLVRRRTGEPPWPVQLYRLDVDPGERDDLAAREPQRTAGLTRMLDARQREQQELARALPSSSGPRSFELPLELEQMLDQLGYGQRDAER